MLAVDALFGRIKNNAEIDTEVRLSVGHLHIPNLLSTEAKRADSDRRSVF